LIVKTFEDLSFEYLIIDEAC
jgi:senataxin